MKNLLFTSMIAEASALYNHSSSLEMQDKVFDSMSGVFTTIMSMMAFVPVIMFGFIFFTIIKARRSQNKMHNNINNIANRVMDTVMDNLNKTTSETETTIEEHSKPSYDSPINTDPNTVIDIDSVLDANNTDPIKKN